MLMKLTHAWPIATLAVALMAVGTAGYAEDGEARALVQRVLEAVPKAPFTAKGKLSSDSGERLLQLSHKRVDDVDFSYMEVTAPSDLDGTRFLLVDRVREPDQQFMRVRGVQRVVQVTEQSRKQPFLGSDFYISDMVRPELDAYEYTFVGEEQVAGRSCKLVQSVPKVAANELYSKTIMAIDPTDLLTMRTQFFDPKGKLLKVWTLDKFEKIDGIWSPLVQKMANVQTGTQSQFELSEIKYNVTLPEEMFERGYLAR
jgi:negative regulator of sigma E activity